MPASKRLKCSDAAGDHNKTVRHAAACHAKRNFPKPLHMSSESCLATAGSRRSTAASDGACHTRERARREATVPGPSPSLAATNVSNSAGGSRKRG